MRTPTVPVACAQLVRNSIARPVFGMAEIIASPKALSIYLWDTILVTTTISPWVATFRVDIDRSELADRQVDAFVNSCDEALKCRRQFAFCPGEGFTPRRSIRNRLSWSYRNDSCPCDAERQWPL